MTRELAACDFVHQLEAFIAYAARDGRLSFEEWMDTKDFSPEDRATLRAAWTRARQEAS